MVVCLILWVMNMMWLWWFFEGYFGSVVVGWKMCCMLWMIVGLFLFLRLRMFLMCRMLGFLKLISKFSYLLKSIGLMGLLKVK